MSSINDLIAAAVKVGPGAINDKLMAFFGANFIGDGSPEGVITAPVGARYQQLDGAVGSQQWEKQSGTGNTGWAVAGSGTYVALGPSPTGASDSTSLQNALNALHTAGGGTLRLPAGSYRIDTGLTIPSDVRLEGAGPSATKLLVQGGIIGLTYQPGDITSRGGVKGVQIIGADGSWVAGNSNAAAVGLLVSDCFGFQLWDVDINSFNDGPGLRLHNVTIWTEGFDGNKVRIRDCATAIELKRTNASGGTNSFGYFRLRSASITVGSIDAAGIGIDVGSTGDAVLLYHADIQVNMWIRTNGIGIRVRNGSEVHTSRLDMRSEPESGATGTVLIQTDATSNFQCDGFVDCTSTQTLASGNNIWINGINSDLAERQFLAPILFSTQGGTPTYNATGGIASAQQRWLFTNGVQQVVIAQFEVPPTWRQAVVDLIWSNAGAGSGNVTWRIQVVEYTDGSNTGSTVADTTTTITAGAQDVQTRTKAFLAAFNVNPAKFYRISVLRTTSGDTLGNQAAMVGCVLRRAA